jgi:hypothetical protein
MVQLQRLQHLPKIQFPKVPFRSSLTRNSLRSVAGHFSRRIVFGPEGVNLQAGSGGRPWLMLASALVATNANS